MKSEYGEMSIEELRDQENQLRTALFNLRVKATTKTLENPSQIRATRRDLARVMTALRSRQPAAAK